MAQLNNLLVNGDARVLGTLYADLGSDVVNFSRSLSSGTKIGTLTINGTATDLYCETNTDTNTKVTAVGNHYTPAANSSYALSVDASSTTSASWASTSLVTGVNLQRDAAGHVTGVTVDSIRMPSNPNTNTTYSLSKSANTITLTPSSGSATTATNVASLDSNNTFTSASKNVFNATSTYNTKATSKFIVGGTSSAFVIGGDGLQCYSDVLSTSLADTTTCTGKQMYINFYGGPVQIGKSGGTDAVNLCGTVQENGTALSSKYMSKVTSIGDSNTPCYINNSGVPTACTSLDLNTSGYASKAYINSTTSNTNYYIVGATGTGSQSLYRAYNSSGTANTTGVYFNGSTGVLFGAAWNDYAEFRNQVETVEPGYCVASQNDGKVYKTTEKFQACDGIVSDTFGFAIGQTDECATPLAVAGRVLAYCEGDRYDYNAGDTVCAGPNGKVMKMTREEIKEWPDRIVGIVSEIPEYETWGTGNVQVNGRIWVKIKG